MDMRVQQRRNVPNEADSWIECTAEMVSSHEHNPSKNLNLQIAAGVRKSTILPQLHKQRGATPSNCFVTSAARAASSKCHKV